MAININDKATIYRMLLERMEAYTENEKEKMPLLANASALIYELLPDLNWAGFYLMEEGELVLGPFQGKAARMRIAVGDGVCGTAVKKDETQVVEDVHQFCGHIACDFASNAEIVIPIRKHGSVIGVLDIDSPLFGRFDEEDKKGLEKLVHHLEEKVKWSDTDDGSIPGPDRDTWAHDAQGDLKDWIEEQGIQLRY